VCTSIIHPLEAPDKPASFSVSKELPQREAGWKPYKINKRNKAKGIIKNKTLIIP
jgi:hypothetical protein